MALEDYSQWKLDELRRAVDKLTDTTATTKGVKYRMPKRRLSFGQALQLYAMTLVLVRWRRSGPTSRRPASDMVDFTNRLRHQLPRNLRL